MSQGEKPYMKHELFEATPVDKVARLHIYRDELHQHCKNHKNDKVAFAVLANEDFKLETYTEMYPIVFCLEDREITNWTEYIANAKDIEYPSYSAAIDKIVWDGPGKWRWERVPYKVEVRARILTATYVGGKEPVSGSST